ncbi:protein of unknown function [Brevefilum fermentans]|uniref:Uncharacterized protein n=1 Tax=Candidatus Brevifilum fermentans TaxID=1986204 RepID=A0A1Y6K2R0_9CHLR|nr:protein of unknown function [Brevefilum fermentans]
MAVLGGFCFGQRIIKKRIPTTEINNHSHKKMVLNDLVSVVFPFRDEINLMNKVLKTNDFYEVTR